MEIIKQVTKNGLFDFVKSTKKSNILYKTFDLNGYTKLMYIYNGGIYDGYSLNMNVNFKNKINRSKVHKDAIINIVEETNQYLLRGL